MSDSVSCPLTVSLQVCFRDFFWRHQLVMLLGSDTDAILTLLKFEQRDDIVLHELRRNWPADQRGKFLSTDGEVLLNLHNAQPVSTTFSLDGKGVMDAFLVHANVDLIRLHLPHFGHRGPQVVLKRVAGNATEDVDKAVERKIFSMIET